MKNIIINISVGLVCLALGYATYPILNKGNKPDINNEMASAGFTVAAESNLAASPSSSHSQGESQILGSAQKTNSVNQPSVEDSIDSEHFKVEHPLDSAVNKDDHYLDDSEAYTDNEIDSPVASASQPTSQSTSQASTPEQVALNDWSAEHKVQIDDLVTSYLSDKSAKHMKSRIFEDNDFLTEPTIKQDPEDDMNWAYNMEEQLKLIISQHELSDSFELVNLTCKQLMCDIFGVEKTSNTWIKLYVSLLQNASNIELPNGQNDPKSVVYMEDGVAVVYAQLRFINT